MSGDNKPDSKFMAMLERRGIVRKVELEDDSPALAHVGSATRLESDTPAERSEQAGFKGSQYENELNSLLQEADASIAAAQSQLEPLNEENAGTNGHHQSVSSPETHTSDNTTGYAARQNPSYDEAPAYQHRTEEAALRDNMFSWMSNEDAAAAPPPPMDDSTERYLDIEELYEVLSLRSKKTDTIYLIEDYLKSIPDTLPDESRRQIVTKIVAASGFDYDLLMGDGILRVKMLKEYAEKFARHTDDYVEARMTEISALESELDRIHGLIDTRRELHKKQFLSIEAEASRLREILTFING